MPRFVRRSVIAPMLLLLCVKQACAQSYSVGVVVAPGFYLLDAMGPLDIFRAVQLRAYENVNLTSHEYHPGVPGGVTANATVHADLLADTQASTVAASDGVVVTPDGSVAAPPRARYDLVVVPAGADSVAIRDFVRAHYAAGGSVLSVCTGVDLIASLGLLDGREATSNSLLLWRMRKRYPGVKWVSLRDRIDRRFVVSVPPNRLLTTAGVTAGVDGALHYVRAWLGSDVAEAVREFVEWPLKLEMGRTTDEV